MKRLSRIVLPLVSGAVIAVVAYAVVGLTGCTTKHISYHFKDEAPPPKHQKQSVPLFLPRTVLEFQANWDLEIASASPLYLEAISADKTPRFGTNELYAAAGSIEVEVATNDTKTIKLKDASLAVRGERDPGQLFYVYLDDNYLTAVDFEAEYTPDGVANSITSARQNQALDFSLKMIESAAAIAGAFVRGMPAPPAGIRHTPGAQGRQDIPGKLAARILQIRAQREALLFKPSERFGLDGIGLSRTLDELAKEEASLLRWFTGSTRSLSTPLRVTVRPKRDELVSEVLLVTFDAGWAVAPAGEPADRVTLGAGVVQTQSLSGTQTNAGRLVLRFGDREPAELEALANLSLATKTSGGKGLPYQVPTHVPASVDFEEFKGGRTNRTTVLTADLLIGQWGVVARLPVSMGTPGSTLKPVYYTESGALKKLTVASKPPSTDALQSLSAATGSISEAVKVREEATSDIGQLKREKERLELEVAIKKAREELSKTNSAASGGIGPE